jgi:hypothetical protein
MKIITRGVIDWATGKILEEDSYEYQGPMALAADARQLGDSLGYPMVVAGANATAPTTPSGSWIDISNAIGDLLLILNLGSVTGAFGSLKVQLQSATANTGASATNEAADPRNLGLITAGADGVFVIPYKTDFITNQFVGVACTFTGITAATFGVELVLRPKIH